MANQILATFLFLLIIAGIISLITYFKNKNNKRISDTQNSIPTNRSTVTQGGAPNPFGMRKSINGLLGVYGASPSGGGIGARMGGTGKTSH